MPVRVASEHPVTLAAMVLRIVSCERGEVSVATASTMEYGIVQLCYVARLHRRSVPYLRSTLYLGGLRRRWYSVYPVQSLLYTVIGTISIGWGNGSLLFLLCFAHGTHLSMQPTPAPSLRDLHAWCCHLFVIASYSIQ